MARYTKAVCRLCRREGTKLFLKGTRCYVDKCSIERRSYRPGEHGQRRVRHSDSAIQLREKQKMKRSYGLLEKQFRSYFGHAQRKKGVTGELLLQFLERRLDNVIFKLGFAISLAQARQFVCHGHILINGAKVDIPSYLVKEDELVGVKNKRGFSKKITELIKITEQRPIPGWLLVDQKNLTGKILRLPARQDIQVPFQEKLIVELYSK